MRRKIFALGMTERELEEGFARLSKEYKPLDLRPRPQKKSKRLKNKRRKA